MEMQNNTGLRKMGVATRGMNVPRELSTLLQRFGRPRQLERGERLEPDFHAGNDLFLVESGAIKLSLDTTDGDEIIVGLFFEGDVLGVQSLGAPDQMENATALEHTRLRALSLDVLKALSRENPFLQRQLFHLASRRIAELQQHLLAISRRGAVERVAAFLVELAERNRRLPDGSVRLPLSLYGIGCYLGMTLETVCRALTKLEQDGVIRKHGRTVRLLDYDTLLELTGGLPFAAASGAYPRTLTRQ